MSAAPAPRRVYFESHIRPMFRALDREHMSFKMNLWEYLGPPGPTRLEYEKIGNRLVSTASDTVMPPPEAGGPWPKEWIDLYQRWLADGAPRLERATVDTSTLQAVRDTASGTVELQAGGTKPSGGHVVWLERHFDPSQLYNGYADDAFDIYQEQIRLVSSGPTPFVAEDTFEFPSALTTLYVFDSVGRHSVTIT